MGMCCKKKTLIGWRNIWNMRWRAPDQEVYQRGHGKRLCKKIAKHVIWTRRMLWIVVDGRSWRRLDDDKDGKWVSVSSGTASPGWSVTKGRIMVVVAVVVPSNITVVWFRLYLLFSFQWWGTGMVVCLEWGAIDLYTVQPMPLPPHRLLLQ